MKMVQLGSIALAALHWFACARHPTPAITPRNVRLLHQYAQANAGEMIRAAINDLPPQGGVIDARGLEGEQYLGKQTLVLAGKPITLLLSPGVVLNCWDNRAHPDYCAANPCVSFGDNVHLAGGTGDGSGKVTAIKNRCAQAAILAPASDQDVSNLRIDGIDFWAAEGTDDNYSVLDLRNTSYARLESVFVQKRSGNGACIRVRKDHHRRAYYNNMTNVRLYGGDGGIGYDLQGGANDFKVFGGTIGRVATAVRASGSPGDSITGVSFYDVSAEAYSSCAIEVKQYALDVRWIGGRLESQSGSLLQVGEKGVQGVVLLAPHVSGRQTYGTDGGNVIWLGYTNGSPGPESTIYVRGGGINTNTILAGRHLQLGNSSGPTISSGDAAPRGPAKNGSLYLRTDGAGPCLYVRENNAWVPR